MALCPIINFIYSFWLQQSHPHQINSASKQAAKKIEEKSKKTKRTKKNNVKKTQTSRGNATFNDSSMDDINIIEEEDGIMEVDFDDSQLDQSQLQTQQTQKTPAATTNRKAQYTGGLVLEPKRGVCLF